MKVVFIEGLDNTGKSTVINRIKTYFEIQNKVVEVIHFTAPPSGMSVEATIELQNKNYLDSAEVFAIWNRMDEFNVFKHIDVLLVDRCWYSEYVYGQLYRNRTEVSVLSNIYKVESILQESFKKDDLTFILLDVDNLDFSVKYEDGLSISKADLFKLEEEQNLFNEVFFKSTLTNKCHVIVNNGLEFKDKDIIFNQIIEAVNK